MAYVVPDTLRGVNKLRIRLKDTLVLLLKVISITRTRTIIVIKIFFSFVTIIIDFYIKLLSKIKRGHITIKRGQNSPKFIILCALVYVFIYKTQFNTMPF